MTRIRYNYQFTIPAAEYNALSQDQKLFQLQMYTQNILGTICGMVHVAPENSDLGLHINLNILNYLQLPDAINQEIISKNLILSVSVIGSGDGLFIDKNYLTSL